MCCFSFFFVFFSAFYMALKYKKNKPVQLFLVYNSGPLTTVANEVQILCIFNIFIHFGTTIGIIYFSVWSKLIQWSKKWYFKVHFAKLKWKKPRTVVSSCMYVHLLTIWYHGFFLCLEWLWTIAAIQKSLKNLNVSKRLRPPPPSQVVSPHSLTLKHRRGSWNSSKEGQGRRRAIL